MYGIFLIIAFLSLAVGVAWGVFGPFSQAVKGKVITTRFVTSDFIWLIMLLQYPLAFLLLVRDRQDINTLSLFGGMLVLVFVIVWLRGTAILSGLRIYSVVRRGVFLVILVPAALLGAFFGLPLMIGLFDERLSGEPATLILSVYGLLTITFVLRRVSRWVLAGARVEPVSIESKAG